MKNAENWPVIVAKKDARIAELEALVKPYEAQFRINKHRQFGASSEKSEYDFNQLSLFNEAETTADDNIPEPELSEIQRHYRKRPRLVNDKLPESLPVEVVVHDLPVEDQRCPVCDGAMHVMGRDKRRELKSYMWLYRTSGDAKSPIVLYDYQPDRRAKRPAEFLKDFMTSNQRQ